MTERMIVYKWKNERLAEEYRRLVKFYSHNEENKILGTKPTMRLETKPGISKYDARVKHWHEASDWLLVRMREILVEMGIPKEEWHALPRLLEE